MERMIPPRRERSVVRRPEGAEAAMLGRALKAIWLAGSTVASGCVGIVAKARPERGRTWRTPLPARLAEIENKSQLKGPENPPGGSRGMSGTGSATPFRPFLRPAHHRATLRRITLMSVAE